MLALDIVYETVSHGTGHVDVGLSVVIIVTAVIGAVTGILSFAVARHDGPVRLPERTARQAERLDELQRR